MIEQQIVNGVMLGSVYALVAVAFTLTIGVLNFLNFSIPGIFMLAGMLTWFALRLEIAWPLAALLAVAAGGLVSLVVERFTFRLMHRSDHFVPLVTSLTLAVRLAGQILFGDVPFYELARFDDSYALGGPYGVRGIPAGRFAGKVKLLGNLELRDELLTFHALGKPLLLGAVAFADGGRLWTDFGPHPELDGTGLGLHFGLGGGLRLQSGSAFVLRVDVAWSLDALAGC